MNLMTDGKEVITGKYDTRKYGRELRKMKRVKIKRNKETRSRYNRLIIIIIINFYGSSINQIFQLLCIPTTLSYLIFFL